MDIFKFKWNFVKNSKKIKLHWNQFLKINNYSMARWQTWNYTTIMCPFSKIIKIGLFLGLGCSLHKILRILYIKSRSPSVRLSKTTVPRFNSPAKPARTIGRFRVIIVLCLGEVSRSMVEPAQQVLKPRSWEPGPESQVLSEIERSWRLLHRVRC